jgi:hypothetical protein
MMDVLGGRRVGAMPAQCPCLHRADPDEVLKKR